MVTSYEGNKTQEYDEISPHTSENGKFQKRLERNCVSGNVAKRNSHTLLMEMLFGTHEKQHGDFSRK